MKMINVDLATGTITESEISAEDVAVQQQNAVSRAWEQLRIQRNGRLAECDWTVLSDTPTSTAAWKAYRQELRDLTANTTDPFNPVWPTPPA